ncbi:MAG TPA: hypothetical protein VKG44_10765 [Candidatus Baltobacteraceae bacterium]|nr:hypothetical protein [Candidatus Baltobacteraceae bacterium]
MRFPRSILSAIGVDTVMRLSRIRVGKHVRVQGAPAILAGVATVILASGLVRFIDRAAPMLPEGLREARELFKAVRGERPELNR